MLSIATLAALQIQNPSNSSGQAADAATYGYRVVHAYPHDAAAYTQGLLYRDGFLFESTGLNGRSTLRKVRLESGEVIQRCAVDPKYFAEGLTDWGDQLIQLTWLSNIGFFYDLSTFKVRGTFRFSGEGWGLAHDRQRLIMSDGSSTLRFLDPATFQEIGRLAVKDRGESVKNLNELEVVRNEIFANVWHTDRIARIEPRSGQVVGWIDLQGLLPTSDRRDPEAVLNGIAYDAARDRLFVTGKLWPKLFEIRLERRR
ncbi:MAG: glutaminyl-peptide cyclotransferase [Acidobacteriia bacterium]|nr:glutaminyl-peptide cyclotransferase [Terriglobia bacterium]